MKLGQDQVEQIKSMTQTVTVVCDTIELLKKSTFSGADAYKVMNGLKLLEAFKNETNATIRKMKHGLDVVAEEQPQENPAVAAPAQG